MDGKSLSLSLSTLTSSATDRPRLARTPLRSESSARSTYLDTVKDGLWRGAAAIAWVADSTEQLKTPELPRQHVSQWSSVLMLQPRYNPE